MKVRGLIAALLAGACMAGSAGAQTATDLGLRVGKLEKEMRAVQRTVFPNGAPVSPEIGAPAPAPAAGTPSLTPVADLTARVDALEKGLASMTGQVEQNGYRLRQAEDALKRLEARVATLEGGAPAAAGSAEPAPPPRPATTTVSRPATPPPTSAARPDPARKAAVAAVEMPATGDAAEDAYTYGFRLHAAKFYPEAEAALKAFVAKYPTHRRASYAQNLLGRAYFDEGKPALASVAFYDNYQKMPKGERAAESLSRLGEALIKLKKPADACKVFEEFTDVYGAGANGELKARVAKGRADAKCAA